MEGARTGRPLKGDTKTVNDYVEENSVLHPVDAVLKLADSSPLRVLGNFSGPTVPSWLLSCGITVLSVSSKPHLEGVLLDAHQGPLF